MIRSTTVWLCLLALVAGAIGQCVQDFECGNVPYTMCNGGINECATTVPGIGIDRQNNEIYFAQVCRTEDTHNFLSNITIKKIGPSGGIPTIVQTRIQLPAAAINPGAIFDVVGDNLYYGIQSRSPGQLLTALSLSTLKESATISTEYFFQDIIEFDETTNKTYVVNVVFGQNGTYYYEIRRFDGILGQGDYFENQTLYVINIPQYITGVRVLSGNLYFSVVTPNADYTAYTTTFYQGSTSCNNCSAPSAALFTVDGRVVDFDLTADKIFYGTTTSVYSSTLSGGDVSQISWSAGATGIRILGNRVYWNSGVAILSDSLNGDDVQQINFYNGTCACRTGFTGDTCTTCTNGQVQWYYGNPLCVPLGSDGNPTTCNFDYECLGSPYVYCVNTCTCRTGFTGTGCRDCKNATQTVTWENGTPYCK